MKVSVLPDKTIEIDDDLVEFLKKQDLDFRVSTSCFGAEIIPVAIKSPKLTDLRVRIGPNILYISKVQANYIKRIEKSMLRHSDLAEIERCFLDG
jgi:hypothetical protein